MAILLSELAGGNTLPILLHREDRVNPEGIVIRSLERGRTAFPWKEMRIGMGYTDCMQLVDRGHVKHQGAIIVLSGETYRNARTGKSYILKIIRGNTILLEEEHGKGQLLMSYEQFEREYVKSRTPERVK